MTKDRRKQINRESYLRNKERVLARSRARYLANRERILAQTAEYHKLHPEVAQKACRKHQRIHRDKCLASNRAWYSRNIESQRKRSREKNKLAYATRKARVLAVNKLWRDANKDKIRSRDMRRRALLKGAAVNLRHMKEWMASIKSRPTARCYYCDSVIPSSAVHFDHIVSLKRGGSHSVDNLCVSCAPCNLSKRERAISAWVRIGQQTLDL